MNNATCCGANNTEFSALEGMRCGAGHANHVGPNGANTLPWDSSEDPGHMVDSAVSNTYRALRFVSKTRGSNRRGQCCHLTSSGSFLSIREYTSSTLY